MECTELVLARSSRRLPEDWQSRYGYRPLLLETFVQSDRFVGTSYRAANWIHVGQTQGRGKLDVYNQHALPKKDKGHLSLSAPPGFPPPLRSARSSPQPVDRIFTACPRRAAHSHHDG